MIFYNIYIMLRAKVRHKSSYIKFSAWGSTIMIIMMIASLHALSGRSSEQPLCDAPWQNCCPCQLWPVPRFAPFWSQRTASLCHGHESGFQVISMFDHCTSLRCFAGTFRLICLGQKKMISVRWQVEEMVGNSRCGPACGHRRRISRLL